MMPHERMNTFILLGVVALQPSMHVGHATGKRVPKRGTLMHNGYWSTQKKCAQAYLIPTQTDGLSCIVL